jgi:DNA polymerase iota
LVPPYAFDSNDQAKDNVTSFLDDHEVGKIPGIGFKIAQKLRAYVLQRPVYSEGEVVPESTKESVTVYDVRMYPGMGQDVLDRVLGGPGVPHGTGGMVWGLLNGCDDTEVGQARDVPKQISIEDSYARLDTLDAVAKELRVLATSLLDRMHTDLLENDEDHDAAQHNVPVDRWTKRWIAHPKTVRLSTRPRPPQNPDGSRNRSFARISRSAPMPAFVFNLKDSTDSVADKLLSETLIPLFRKLHPEKKGWNLSLVNIAATNIADAASEKGGIGRDISKMFKRQDEVLKQWRVEEQQPVVAGIEAEASKIEAESSKIEAESRPTEALRGDQERVGSEDIPTLSQEDESVVEDHWESEDEDLMDVDSFRCEDCGAVMPTFAMGAHYRWHVQV